MTTFETCQLAIGGAGVLAVLLASWLAFILGLKQNEINSRLLQIQDYVSISVAPNKHSIALWNTGKSNLYMWGFDMPGNNQRFDKPRLISPSTVANYWIPAPNTEELSKNKNFEFKLYLTDEYENKWISENGGEATTTTIVKDGKNEKAFNVNVWSYKTVKTDW